MERVAPADVRHITCVGAGVIGGGWVAYFLAHGFHVTAWDPGDDAEERLRLIVDNAWPALTDLGAQHPHPGTPLLAGPPPTVTSHSLTVTSHLYVTRQCT